MDYIDNCVIEQTYNTSKGTNGFPKFELKDIYAWDTQTVALLGVDIIASQNSQQRQTANNIPSNKIEAIKPTIVIDDSLK